MLYMVIGKSKGMQSRHGECYLVEASDKNEAMSKIKGSILYYYTAAPYDREKYAKLKSEGFMMFEEEPGQD